MKKTIVKVLAIVFVVSILVSSMFVMTGAACGDYTMTVKFQNRDYAEITYDYDKANERLEVKSITIHYDYNRYCKKHVLASNLYYDKKAGCFEKDLIALTDLNDIDYTEPSTDIHFTSLYATIMVYTNYNRAPKKGDRVSIQVVGADNFSDSGYISSIYIG